MSDALQRALGEAELLLTSMHRRLAVETGEAIAEELRPTVDDYERVFIEEVAPRARDYYVSAWDTHPAITARADQHLIDIHVAWSHQLTSGEVPGFPRGYEHIAPYLRPHVIWVCWRFRAPGAVRGHAFDGLVRLTDRFAWFPKPWSLVRGAPGPLAHWGD